MTMKKIGMLMLLLAVSWTAQAEGERAIDPAQLPERARAFLATHFAERAVSLAKADRDLFELRYEVVLMGGEKVEFNRSGEWDEVSCRYASVPMAIVPEPIRRYLAQHHPDRQVVEINREHRRYEVELAGGPELKFDTEGRLVGWDD